jgi:hypothetical protein
MADLHKCDLYVVRYEPNVAAGNRINIGVILVEEGHPKDAFVGVRFRRDWGILRALDPNFDPELIEALELDVESQLRSWEPQVINYRADYSRRQWILEQMRTAWAGALRVSQTIAVQTHSPAQELGIIVDQYLTIPSAEKTGMGGRTFVYNGMKNAFEIAGVWHTPYLRKRIAPELFARTGDPLKIDCGYRPNGEVKLFHAISLKSGIDAAKALALSFPQFRVALSKAEDATCKLTAVVEDDYDATNPAVGFALEILQTRDIGVAQLSQMPAIAEQARGDLRL